MLTGKHWLSAFNVGHFLVALEPIPVEQITLIKICFYGILGLQGITKLDAAHRLGMLGSKLIHPWPSFQD